MSGEMSFKFKKEQIDRFADLCKDMPRYNQNQYQQRQDPLEKDLFNCSSCSNPLAINVLYGSKAIYYCEKCNHRNEVKIG
jgi:hypothetical protein